MNGEQRRQQIVAFLSECGRPVSGAQLARRFSVSRQIIVQDVALIRQGGEEVISTNRGYLLQKKNVKTRVFKMRHTDDEVEEELSLIVRCGGRALDVFVYHKVYGVVRAPLDIASGADIARYMEEIRTGKSSPLKNVTSGYHYHTVAADSEETLDRIQEELQQRGFLARLQEHEPVDFWNEEKEGDEHGGA